MKQNNLYPSIKSLIELEEPSDPQISPDGKKIAYVVRYPDWDLNAYNRQVRIINVDSSNQDKENTKFGSSHSPRWSPDNQLLSIVTCSPDQGAPSLRIIANSDGALLKEIPINQGGYAFAWSPDGHFIAYLAMDESLLNLTENETDEEVVVVGEKTYQSQIWMLNLDNHQSHQVTKGNFHVTGFSWHPAGNQIAFSACPTSLENDWDLSQIFTVNLLSEGIKSITTSGFCMPQWSPNGDHIALTKLGIPSFIGIPSIGIFSLKTSEIKILKPFDNDFHLLTWGKDGIYALAIDGVTSHLYRIDPLLGYVKQLTPNNPPGFTITEGWIGLGCSFDTDYKKTSFVSYDRDHFAEITILDCKTEKTRRVTNFTAQIKGWHLPTPDLVQWESYDGLIIEGILIPPVNYKSEEKYPLVVVAHGGPTHTSMLAPLVDSDWWYGAIPQLTHKGSFILMPNYRGSCGYGGDFQASNAPKIGIVELHDILTGVDKLISEGKVDSSRIGIIGVSHGGYLAALAATYSNQFRAAVMISGVSDWALNFYLADTRKWMKQYLQSTPWENQEIYQYSSPMNYISQAQTPLLIQHGEKDQRAPVSQAFQIHRGLRDNGVEARLLVYPGIGHGISKPKQYTRCIKETLAWFSRWLWDE